MNKRRQESEVPDQTIKGVELLRVKSRGHLDKGDFSRERRSRNIDVSVTNIRAATYDWAIVTMYIVSWSPFFIFCLYKSFSSFEHEISERSSLDLDLVKDCLVLVLHDQSCYLSKDSIELTKLIQAIFESEKTRTIVRMLGVYLTMLNSIANPILYAFWYPEFRKYLLKSIHWCKGKCTNMKRLAENRK